ncbi:unnamed protein product [Nesidiocoris tenuis]|nr:unnamed protein product [Nesidiocoris tenuis]
MERGSIGGSYFIVQLPDGSMEKRMKMPVNIDPGVHSIFNLNELVGPGTPVTPNPTLPVLPTITEAKITEQSGSSGNSSSGSNAEMKLKSRENPNEAPSAPRPAMPRNQSQPAFSTQTQGLPKNGSVPFFDRMRKTSQAELCPCLTLPDSFKTALAAMLDYTLLKDPVFLLIGISNVFGMAGLYVPFVYLVDAAVQAGLEQSKASFLLSIIGITNTFGRVLCGWVADFPSVNSLLLNNISLVVSTVAVGAIPFCTSYEMYVAVAVAFGLAISAYISLTSIILVDLLGLDKLTNAFGLLILFRGAAAIVGSPLAGIVYDATKTYTIPFLMASIFFLLSTITSFMAPMMKSCVKSEPEPVMMDALTPIEEDEEDEDDEDDDGGADLPEIVETAPSPASPPPNSTSIEIKQIESVL